MMTSMITYGLLTTISILVFEVFGRVICNKPKNENIPNYREITIHLRKFFKCGITR